MLAVWHLKYLRNVLPVFVLFIINVIREPVYLINFDISVLVRWRISEQTGGTIPTGQMWRENGWASSRAAGFQITGTSVQDTQETHLIIEPL